MHKIFRTDGPVNHDRVVVLRVAKFGVIRVIAVLTILGHERVLDAQIMLGLFLHIIEARREPLRQSELERELILADFRRHSKLKSEVYDLVTFFICMRCRRAMTAAAAPAHATATGSARRRRVRKVYVL